MTVGIYEGIFEEYAERIMQGIPKRIVKFPNKLSNRILKELSMDFTKAYA